MPIKKDKLFFFGSYQYTHASDEEIGISRAFVPPGLTDDRSAAALAALANTDSMAPSFFRPRSDCEHRAASIGTGNGQLNPIAYTLFNYKLPNGQFLIPSANPNAVIANPAAFGSNPAIQSAMVEAFPENAEVPGTALFLAHQAVADLDWNPNSTHSFSAQVLLPA